MSYTSTGWSVLGQWMVAAAHRVKNEPRGAWTTFVVTMLVRHTKEAYRSIAYPWEPVGWRGQLWTLRRAALRRLTDVGDLTAAVNRSYVLAPDMIRLLRRAAPSIGRDPSAHQALD